MVVCQVAYFFVFRFGKTFFGRFYWAYQGLEIFYRLKAKATDAAGAAASAAAALAAAAAAAAFAAAASPIMRN